MKKVLIETCKRDDTAYARFNSFLVLKQAKQLDALIVWDFHKITLSSFDTRYQSPQDFDEALAYFKIQLKSKKANEVRNILKESKQYVNDYIQRCIKNGREKDTVNSKVNIKMIDAVLLGKAID
jgi:hypothetical protein